MAKITKKVNKKFWDKEYKDPRHLKISSAASGDLVKFFRWNTRQKEPLILNKKSLFIDLGCGNGRNSIYIATESGATGIGYDISESAIAQAKVASIIKVDKKQTILPLTYQARSIVGTFPDIADGSVDLVLDMMVSHFLREAERKILIEEVNRMLRPGGYYIFKTFLGDGDLNVKRLLHSHPGGEMGSYIHPEMNVYEHVYTEAEIKKTFDPYFDIHKIEKSHKHISHGKRRSVIVYLEQRW